MSLQSFAPHRAGRRLGEPLEERCCLSVTVMSVAVDGTNELQIVSDDAGDTINIMDAGNGQVEVTDGRGAVLGSADNVSSIQVMAGGGNDVVNYSLAGQLMQAQALEVALEDGDDSATLDFSAGVNADLHVHVKGGAGEDTVASTMGDVSGDAEVKVSLDGGADADDVSLLATAITIDADAALRARLNGGKGADAVTATLEGEIFGNLGLSARGGKGEDTVIANVTAAAGSTGRLWAVARGDQGIDEVTLNVLDESGEDDESLLDSLHAKIFDPRGMDELEFTDNVDVFPRFGHGLGQIGNGLGQLGNPLQRLIGLGRRL